MCGKKEHYNCSSAKTHENQYKSRELKFLCSKCCLLPVDYEEMETINASEENVTTEEIDTNGENATKAIEYQGTDSLLQDSSKTRLQPVRAETDETIIVLKAKLVAL